MPNPGRFTSGVATRPSQHPMGNLPFPDPTRFYVFSDDFDHTYVAVAAGVAQWNAIAASAATAYGIISAPFGQALFAPQAANAAFGVVRWSINTTPLPLFSLSAGKKFWLRSRFKTEDADQNNLYVGAAVATADPFGTEPPDQFAFRSLNAAPDSLMLAVGATASTEVTIALGTTADDTWTTCTAYYDGKDTVSAWRESDAGVILARGQVSVANGTLLPDVGIAPTFGMQNKDNGGDDFTIDYITLILER